MGTRNKVLQGLRLDVYRYVTTHHGCTRRDVAIGLDLPNNVATARIKELIDDGYVYESGERKRNPSGVMAKVLIASDKPEDMEPVHKVKVAVSLRIDHLGRYVPTAHILDQKEQGDPMQCYGASVAEKVISLPIKFDRGATTISKAEASELYADAIDADYVVDYGD